MQTTKFDLHDVEIGKWTENKNPRTLQELFSFKSDGNTQTLEACSKHETELYGGDYHGLFSAVSYAYDKHIGLELHPDHFKLLILQGFAIHVNENAEALRGLFVAHEGKKKIEIMRDDFVKGSPNNPWTEVFDQFASKISNDLNDKELVGLVQGPLSTSTPTTVASFNVSLMDAMQQYFEYKMYTKCGIPFVELKGTSNDWQSLITLVNCIEKF